MTAAPAVPFVEGEALEPHLDRAGADGAQRAAAKELRESGYCVLDLRDDEVLGLCDAIVSDLSDLFARGAVRVQDAWRLSPSARRLACHAGVLDFLRIAYGREPFPFQTLNFEYGSGQSVHADAYHFHSDPPLFMCGAWWALEDVRAEAGPLVYYPGSHRLPPLADDPDEAAYGRAVQAQIAERGLAPATAMLKKGQALIWAARLLHGGAPVQDPAATRRSLVTHYYFDGCVYTTPRAGRSGRVRLPADVRTGRLRWPRRNGRPVAPHWRDLAGALARKAAPHALVFGKDSARPRRLRARGGVRAGARA